MAAGIYQKILSTWTAYRQPPEEGAPPWMDQHVAKVAFAVSTLVLFLFSPFSFLGGTAVGFALHYAVEPLLKEQNVEITPTDAVMTLVGAVAQVLKWTPAGQAGNFIFQSIPFVSTLAIGSVGYRMFRVLY